MDAASWVSVFQRIPPEKEDLLVIVTTSGIELIIQKIVRVEAEFVIVKGRLSGATDAARAVLMPYDQINNLAINKQLLEPDILTAFGFSGSSTSVTAAPAAPAKAEDGSLPAPSPKEDVAAAPATASPSQRPALTKGSAPPSKSLFLERLRARLGTESSKTDKA